MMVLKADKITKIYSGTDDASSTNALNGVDISIDEGEFVGVMGPSGSGKTTLLNILSGLDKPTTGTVEIDGRQISAMSRDELALFRRSKMGFVFQEFNLLDSLTIKENIVLPLVLGKSAPDEIDRAARELMYLLDIKEIADKYPYHASGGQQQRAAVGRALANNPAVIFADEPTGNLDSRSSRVIMEYFQKVEFLKNKPHLAPPE
jgi:putative ABC transport system ATP-binding protein